MNAEVELLAVEPADEGITAPTTLEEWANMDEDEPGEFVDGKLVEEEDATNLHELVVSWLICTLGGWGRSRSCPVFGSGLKFRVAHERGRKADLCMFAQGTHFRNSMLTRKPPMLIVEVVSRSPRDVKRDRIEKRHEYAKFGVQHYWLVDPVARVFEFLTLGSNGRWNDATDSASEGRVEVTGFEGLVLDLDELWAEVDSIIEQDEEEIVDDEG